MTGAYRMMWRASVCACSAARRGAARSAGRLRARDDARKLHTLMTRARASCVCDERMRHARLEVACVRACVRDDNEDEDEDAPGRVA